VRSLKDISHLNQLSDYDDSDAYYGFKKTVVVVTKNHNIYGLDSITGKVFWRSSFLRNVINDKYKFWGLYNIE